VYNRITQRAGAHTWQTRKCAGVLHPDENSSQGAARMRRVSFTMFRLFWIVFLCVTLLHTYYRILQRCARVNHMVPIYRSHAWHRGRRRCSISIRLLWHMYIIYLYAYTCVRKLRLVTMAEDRKKIRNIRECHSPFASGDRFPVLYWGSGGLQWANEDHQKRNTLVSTVFGTTT